MTARKERNRKKTAYFFQRLMMHSDTQRKGSKPTRIKHKKPQEREREKKQEFRRGETKKKRNKEPYPHTTHHPANRSKHPNTHISNTIFNIIKKKTKTKSLHPFIVVQTPVPHLHQPPLVFPPKKQLKSSKKRTPLIPFKRCCLFAASIKDLVQNPTPTVCSNGDA